MRQHKILHKKQHQVNPIKETVDIKCCVFKVSKYINRIYMENYNITKHAITDTMHLVEILIKLVNG